MNDRQFSLFETRPLFEPETLSRAQTEWDRNNIPNFDRLKSQASDFINEVQKHKVKQLKEEALEQKFNQAFFQELLGYEVYPGTAGKWSAWPKPPTGTTRLTGVPDLLLGHFGEDLFEPVMVVELKRPGVNLDAPQGSYGGLSPVEQAFGYAKKLGSCRWVCVSNMRIIRIYSIESSTSYFEIDLWTTSDLRPILKDLWHIYASENLIKYYDDSATSRLLRSSQDNQVAFQEGFYQIYSDIRQDILNALSEARPDSSRTDMVQATQRLLDRLLFAYFCEDHPDRLLKSNLIKSVVENAVQQPGSSQHKAYNSLKGLFRDLDVGADTPYWKVPRYNGEIFKDHPIIDHIDLNDNLHGKRYSWQSKDGRLRRNVEGVYGLHIFDFWKELDRDLLGNIFEKSIGDLTALADGGRIDARQAFGIYYTTSRLAKFAAASAVAATLAENEQLQLLLGATPVDNDQTQAALAEKVLAALKTHRIADIACGSGAFLTAAFESLLIPFQKTIEAGSGGAMSRELMSYRQSELLQSSIYGCDLLPQAVELAKLSLWLAAARRNEPSADLSKNFANGDSLKPQVLKEILEGAGGKFDLIVGNPPWGAEFESPDQAAGDTPLDSWEIFLRLCASCLEPGGRIALILPDTIFSPAKRATRKWLVENFTIEKLYLLGPDWFSNKVRMGTVFLQAKMQPPSSSHLIETLLLAGSERIAALNGQRPLQQAEAIGSSFLSQSRAQADGDANLSVLLGEEEQPLLEKIAHNSVPLVSISKRARGDEMSASGAFWRCGNCSCLTVPGTKKKGGGFNDKPCPNCGANLSPGNISLEHLVTTTRSAAFKTPYVDGDTLARRYANPERKFIRIDLPVSPPLKDEGIYLGSRVAIRQAGVGITATLLKDGSRVPQSVYLYWSTDEARAQGYTDEFILACLVSRVMNFVHMKTSGEIDPSRAFAKITHDRLSSFPIPKIDSPPKLKIAQEITNLVTSMLAMPELGGSTDWQIETQLRELWGISGDEGRYINGFFSVVPDGQARRDLFPDGPPTRVPFPVSDK